MEHTKCLALFSAVSLWAGAAMAANPLIPDAGMADPHIHIFNNKAYLYTTRDIDPNSPVWIMPDWNVWSSDNLVDWKHETKILPTDTYIGESTACWAPDAATMNGKYYFYFSNKSIDTGVMVSDNPGGPFKDALGKPLLTEEMTPAHEYDISVLVDDGVPYMVFGTHNPGVGKMKQKRNFYLVRLNPDMVSLADAPKPIEIIGDFMPNDKPNLHTYKGRYYLSAGANYTVSDNLYGPYTVRRSEGDDSDPYGLNKRAHGNFFEWNNQWFYTWCRFVKYPLRYRESWMTYVHYKDNGDMVYDRVLLDAHAQNGVGQYSAAWDTIEAEWYMAAEGVQKREKTNGGFEIAGITDGGYLRFPHVKGVKENGLIAFTVSSQNGGTIEVRENSADGPLLGSCTVPDTGGWNVYKEIPCQLTNTAGTKNLCLVFKGTAADLFHLDSFKFSR